MQTVDVTSDVMVDAGEALVFTDADAFHVVHPWDAAAIPRLTIAGTVSVTEQSAAIGSILGISVWYGPAFGPVTVTSSGVLRVTAEPAGRAAFGYSVGEGGPGLEFINQGTVEVSAQGVAEGAGNASIERRHIVNSGSISAVSDGAVAYGIQVGRAPGLIENSGLVTVSGHAGAYGVNAEQGASGSFFNTGTITAHSDDPATPSVGVFWQAGFAAGDVFENDGRIEADYALKTVDARAYNGGIETYTNNGALVGKVSLGGSSATLVNAGSISGDVNLGGGNDAYDGRVGSALGAIDGGAGNDLLQGGHGPEELHGGAGDDTLSSGGGGDLLDGGDGIDLLNLAAEKSSAVVDFKLNTFNGEGTVLNIEQLIGTPFSDHLQGGAATETLGGGAGSDTIDGGGGNDLISGDAGENFLTGGDGDDLIQGGADFDRTNGNVGNDTVHGAAGDDWVTGGQNEDVLFGDDGKDILNGNLGADTADGGAGDDAVRGGQGSDVLSGGAGDDYLTGDLGDDTLSGGAGADTFRAFAGGGHDVVTDFNAAEGDRIQLDPGTTYTATQSGADVVLDLGGGAQTILKNVTLAALPQAWILGG